MSNKLSYSAISTYNTCGRKYYLSYVERWREKKKNSALFFGSAFDVAIGVLLKTNSMEAAKASFDKEWTHVNINKNTNVYLPDCLNILYSTRDLDLDLITDEDRKFLNAKHEELQCPPIDIILSDKKAGRELTKSEQKYLHLYSWCSLRRKGHLMLEAHVRYVRPHIQDVIAIQERITLNNGEDTLSGYIDAIVLWGEERRKTILDYKTSSVKYKDNAISEGSQLTIYSHATSIPTVGYVVFLKTIKKTKHKVCTLCARETTNRSKTCEAVLEGKRCGGTYNETIIPEAECQILIEDITPTNEDKVLDDIESVNTKIHASDFSPNFNSCRMPWGDCPYMKVCHENSYEDVEKI